MGIIPTPDPTRLKTSGGAWRHLTAAEKQSIVAAVATGRTQREVAAEFNVHRNTVSDLCRAVQRIPNSPLSDWKTRLKSKAVKAIESGLDEKRDPYKRAGIGVQVMKGIGEFAADVQIANIYAHIDNTPPEYRERYELISNVAVNNSESTPDTPQDLLPTSTE